MEGVIAIMGRWVGLLGGMFRWKHLPLVFWNASTYEGIECFHRIVKYQWQWVRRWVLIVVKEVWVGVTVLAILLY